MVNNPFKDRIEALQGLLDVGEITLIFRTGQYKGEGGRIWRGVGGGQACVGGEDGHPSIARSIAYHLCTKWTVLLCELGKV